MHHAVLTLQTPSLTKVHLKAPPSPPSFCSPFPPPWWQTYPCHFYRGSISNPHSSFCRFIAFCNLCFFLLHCLVPSHSYTGTVTSLFGHAASSKWSSTLKKFFRFIYLFSANFMWNLHEIFIVTLSHLVSLVPHTSCCLCVGLSGHCCSLVTCLCTVFLTSYHMLSNKLSVVVVSKDTKSCETHH